MATPIRIPAAQRRSPPAWQASPFLPTSPWPRLPLAVPSPGGGPIIPHPGTGPSPVSQRYGSPHPHPRRPASVAPAGRRARFSPQAPGHALLSARAQGSPIPHPGTDLSPVSQWYGSPHLRPCRPAPVAPGLAGEPASPRKLLAAPCPWPCQAQGGPIIPHPGTDPCPVSQWYGSPHPHPRRPASVAPGWQASPFLLASPWPCQAQGSPIPHPGTDPSRSASGMAAPIRTPAAQHRLHRLAGEPASPHRPLATPALGRAKPRVAQ